MSDLAIVDSGFIYALIAEDDRHHGKAWALLNEPRWRFLVPPVVLAEVFHVRIRDSVAEDRTAVTRAFAEALLWVTGDKMPFKFEEMTLSDYRRVAELLTKYADTGVDYVDAVVVSTAERLGAQYIMTAEQRFFRLYIPSFAPHFILPVFDT